MLFFFQAHGSEELSSFCEGYFLQQMPSLLEKEGFKSLLLGPPCSRQGNISTSTLAHSRGDSPMEELEATLARRLRSLHVTSRVWGAVTDSCCEETIRMSVRTLLSSSFVMGSSVHKCLPLVSKHDTGTCQCLQFSGLYLVPKLRCRNWTVFFLSCSERFSKKHHVRSQLWITAAL